MKHLLLILCIIISNKINAQESYLFNKTYKPDTLSIGSPACLPVYGGYLFAGPYVNNVNNNESFHIRKTDFQGETLWFKSYEYGNHGIFAIGGGILIEGHIQTTYLLAGSLYYEGSENKDIVLIHFLQDGTPLWTNYIEQPDSVEGVYHISPTTDGGYIMCGLKRGFTSNGRFYVLKVDELGNMEWDKVYYPDAHGAAFNVRERENDYLVSGGFFFQETNYDAVVLSINKADGSENWMQQFGNDEADTACTIKIDANNNIFALYAIRDIYSNKYPVIAKLDMNGNTILSKTYNNEVVAPEEAPLLLKPDGGVIGLFGIENEFGKYYPSIWSFDAQGDTLWTRSIPDLNPNQNWYLKDIAATPDGGYILSGFNYSTQSSWIVKTDSLGYTCNYLGCEETISSSTTTTLAPTNFSTLHPKPNPSTGQLNIHNPSTKTHLWQLYNAQGQACWQQNLAPQSSQTINLHHLPKGIYFWRLGKYSGKLLLNSPIN